MKIQLIQQLSELDGGEFLEIFPGPYKGRSWNEQSVYIEDKAFALMEPIVKKHAPDFNHRSNTPISKDQWLLIIADLQALSAALASAKSPDELKGKLGSREGSSDNEFNSQFPKNSTSLKTLIDAWVAWLTKELNGQTVISVLGI